jgi:hypothetical protein
MSLTEIQREAAALQPEEQRRLMGYLAGLQISRDHGPELRAQFADRRPEKWIPDQPAPQLGHKEG